MPGLFAKISAFFRNSSHVHVRQEEINDLKALVDLIDRFLNDEPRYPLEWDDFISWPNSNPDVEAWRCRVSDLEPLYFAGGEKRSEAGKMLQRIRDEIALVSARDRRFS